MKGIKIIFVLFLIAFDYLVADVPLVFDSTYSTIKISDGVTFQVNKPIELWDGTLIRSSSGTIAG